MMRNAIATAPGHASHRSSTVVRLRALWLRIHRWLGLTVGLVFVLIGLTGSVLVFDHAIDEWLNPELLISQGSGERASVDQIIAAAESHYADDALSVSKPRVQDGVWSVWFSSGTESDPAFTAVYVDPYTAAVTGQRVWGHDLLSWIYRLHYQLVAGTVGGVIVGVIGLLVIVSVITGIYLWWPLWRHSWRSAFAIRRGKRLNFDVHKVVGALSAVVLLVLAFTGVFMEFYPQCIAAIKWVAPVTEPPADLKSAVGESKEALTADAAIQLAAKLCPEGVFDHLHPPLGEDGHFEVAFRQPGEVQKTFGRTQIFLDQYSGEVLAMRMPSDSTAADTFIAWQFPLHSGEAFGLGGRLLVFASGLTPGMLYVTGFAVWRRKTRRRSGAVTQGRSLPPSGPSRETFLDSQPSSEDSSETNRESVVAETVEASAR